MSEVTPRLRGWKSPTDDLKLYELLEDAAEEIEKLEAQNERFRKRLSVGIEHLDTILSITREWRKRLAEMDKSYVSEVERLRAEVKRLTKGG
jgi:hypothetical protein